MCQSKQLIVVIAVCTIISSCGSLRPAVSTHFSSLSGYSYAYVIPTGDKVGSAGSVYGTQYGAYGSSITRSSNPSELISGFLMKMGYIISPDINGYIDDKAIIVSYGETGRRNTGLGSYTIEVTIQFLDARTRQIICTGTAEGRGSTEADDIRIAIERCMNKIFESRL